MNFCSKFLPLSVFPWCKDSPQIVMVWWEWLGRLKWRATGLDASVHVLFCSASRKCSHCMRKTCRNVFTTLTTAVFLSANMFSFPTLDDLKIVDVNLQACQAEFNLRVFKQNNLLWLLAFLHQYRLQTSNRLKAAAFGIS